MEISRTSIEKRKHLESGRDALALALPHIPRTSTDRAFLGQAAVVTDTLTHKHPRSASVSSIQWMWMRFGLKIPIVISARQFANLELNAIKAIY